MLQSPCLTLPSQLLYQPIRGFWQLIILQVSFSLSHRHIYPFDVVAFPAPTEYLPIVVYVRRFVKKGQLNHEALDFLLSDLHNLLA